MLAVGRILCATDLSPASGPAWEFAQRLAIAVKAELVLLHVLGPMPASGSRRETEPRLREAARRERSTWLQRLVEGTSDPRVQVTVRLDEGSPGPRILTVADRIQADLVVLGTHGRTGLKRLLLGSVAEQVVAMAHRPVITARLLEGASVAPLRGVERIFYATDLSAASLGAWPWARTLAEATGAEVELLHVVPRVLSDEHVDRARLGRIGAYREAPWQGLRRLSVTSELPPGRLHVQLAYGVEAAEIVRWAEARGADLIVMGTQGRSGLVRRALGSVTRQVLHAAPCPVLTVGPPNGPKTARVRAEVGRVP